jgi:pyridoxal phosphate enzyme (YggS family)
MTDIVANLKEIRSRIAEAAERAGRSPDEVTLVAVSKRHSEAAIREAYAAGQRHFGENYAQELRDKAEALNDLDGIRWHFIGHLQRNKAKHVLPPGALVETVDDVSLLSELEKQAVRFEKTLSCLVQVNVGEEEQKSGIDAEDTERLLKAVEEREHLELQGLMIIPPWDLDADETRVYFKALKELQMGHGGPERLPHLSMGMSHDFEEAVEEGATLVRVGTAIFGERPGK